MSLGKDVDYKAIADKFKDLGNETKKKAQKRVNANWKLYMLIGVYITSLLVTGLSEFIQSSWSWDYIGSTEYISSVLLNTLNNLVLLLAMSVYTIDKLVKKDEKGIAIKNKIKERVSKIIASIFILFLNNFNRERRKNKYKHMLDENLLHLETHARSEDLVLWLRGTDEEKKRNQYCAEKAEIIARMDDKWLEEHIDEIYVDIKETNIDYVKYGYKNQRKGYKDPWDIENGFYKALRDLGPKILIGLSITIGFNSLSLQTATQIEWWLAAVAIILKLYPMFINAYIGQTYGVQYYEEKILVDDSRRNDILELGIEYQENYEKGLIHVDERPTVQHPIVVYKEDKNV